MAFRGSGAADVGAFSATQIITGGLYFFSYRRLVLVSTEQAWFTIEKFRPEGA
jgi:hypothetical protein